MYIFYVYYISDIGAHGVVSVMLGWAVCSTGRGGKGRGGGKGWGYTGNCRIFFQVETVIHRLTNRNREHN